MTEQMTVVLEVSGVQWASQKAVVESVFGRRPSVLSMEANPVVQTASVTFDPARTTVAEFAGWRRDYGPHRRRKQGRVVHKRLSDALPHQLLEQCLRKLLTIAAPEEA